MKSQLVKNSLTGIVQSMLVTLLIFAGIPVFIKILGTKDYGIFSALMVIGNLNTFINLGLTSALVKFLAEQGKCAESNFDIVVTLILNAVILFPFTLLAIVLNKFILINVFNLSDKDYYAVKTLFYLMLVSNCFLFMGQVFKAVLDAVQKIDLNNYLQITYNLIYWGLIITVLLLGYKLGELGIVLLISSFLWFVLSLYFCLKYWGTIKIAGISRNFKRIAKKQFSYGAKIYISGLVGFFYEPFSKILISQFIGVTEVGYFDIALRIRSQIYMLILKIFAPLYPLFANLKDKDKIRLYVHDLEQKTFIVVVPFIVTFILIIKPFISLWIGLNIEVLTFTTMAIVTAFMLCSITVVPNYHFLIAHGYAGKTIILQSSNVVFNALFFFFAYKYLGYYAVVIGNVAAIMSSFILSLYYQRKYLNSLIFDSFSQAIKLFIIASLLFAVGFVINIIITSDLGRIIVDPIVIGTMTLYFYRKFKLVTKEDILRYTGNNEKIFRLGIKIFVG